MAASRELTPEPQRADEADGSSVEKLKLRLLDAAYNGDTERFQKLLKDSTNEVARDLLGYLHESVEERATPLTAAASQGHLALVQLLVRHYGVDTEQMGSVGSWSSTSQGVTALWCAVAASKFAVVRWLLSLGANVDHRSKEGRTPLHEACCRGRGKMVQLLLDHRADATALTDSQDSCLTLLLDSDSGTKELVVQLLELGVDPDARNTRGLTALHLAARRGDVGIVAELVKRGAAIRQDALNLTPVMTAAAFGHADVVKYFVRQHSVSQTQEAEVWELLGASVPFQNHGTGDLSLAFKFLRRGLRLRLSSPEGRDPTSEAPPAEGGGAAPEGSPLARLQKMLREHDDFITECHRIRARILGPDHREVPALMAMHAAQLATRGRLREGLALLLQAAEVHSRRKAGSPSSTHVCMILISLFSQMRKADVPLEFADLLRAVLCTVLEIERPTGQSEPHVAFHIFHCQLETFLLLFIIALPLAKGGEEVGRLRDLAGRVVERTAEIQAPFSVLHVAMKTVRTWRAQRQEDLDRDREQSLPPRPSLTSLLLACKGDTNNRDAQGDTVLHVLARHAEAFPDRASLRQTIRELVEAGAHVDLRNDRGKMAAEVAGTHEAREVLRSYLPLPLRTLAARVASDLGFWVNDAPEGVAEFSPLPGSRSDGLEEEVTQGAAEPST